MAPSLPAQEVAAEASARPAPTKKQAEEYASMLTDRLERREERATALVNEIIALDEAVQQSVNQVLQIITNVRDSKDSGTRVARSKREMMDGLGRAIQRYNTLRLELQEDLRRSNRGFLREELFRERDVFDKKIERMVESVIDIAMTMDVHEEHEKYRVVGHRGGGWGWGGGPIKERNPAYQQNLRATRQTSAARSDLNEALQRAIDRLENQVRMQRQKLDMPQLEGENRRIAQAELDRLETILQRRYEQQAALFTQSRSENTARQVTTREFMETERFMESVLADARRDFNQMIARYRDYKVERTAIAEMRDRLEEVGAWLERAEAE